MDSLILSGKEIQRKILTKEIVITPFQEERLNPNSYNVSLNDTLYIYDQDRLDMRKEHTISPILIPEDGLELQPGKLYLGCTDEYTETHGLVPMLEGRSSVGRLGLFIHVTAGFGDIGFEGFWTLELQVVQPLIIYPHIQIGQLYYHTVEGEYVPYQSGKYQKNRGVQPSMMWKDFINK